jgi:hypothetical protein
MTLAKTYERPKYYLAHLILIFNQKSSVHQNALQTVAFMHYYKLIMLMRIVIVTPQFELSHWRHQLCSYKCHLHT